MLSGKHATLGAVHIWQPRGRLGKKHFFVNSEILGMHIWRGKTHKLQQILNRHKLRKSNI